MPGAELIAAPTGILIWALMVLAVAPATAQDPQDTWTGYRDVHHRNDCRLANQVLTHGQPANKRNWAMRIIDTCGPLGGETIGALLREHRFESAWGQELEQVVSLTSDLKDRAIYEAALEIAADEGAGTAARVQALRILYYQISPGRSLDPYESFLPGSRETYAMSFHRPAVANPLPANAPDVIIAATGGLIEDSGTHEAVRSAATTLRYAAEVEAADCPADATLEECWKRVEQVVSPPDTTPHS